MPAVNSAVDLAAWINDPLRTIVAHLAKNDMGDAVNDLNLTNLVECTFPGYAPFELDNLVMDPDSTLDGAHATSDAAQWISGAVVSAETPTIVYYTEVYNGATPHLLSWFPLDDIVPIDRAGQIITQNPEFWAADLS